MLGWVQRAQSCSHPPYPGHLTAPCGRENLARTRWAMSSGLVARQAVAFIPWYHSRPLIESIESTSFAYVLRSHSRLRMLPVAASPAIQRRCMLSDRARKAFLAVPLARLRPLT
jgi:hypothetical protein